MSYTHFSDSLRWRNNIQRVEIPHVAAGKLRHIKYMHYTFRIVSPTSNILTAFPNIGF
jgi:hypothetical protein